MRYQEPYTLSIFVMTSKSLVFAYGIKFGKTGMVETTPIVKVGVRSNNGAWWPLFLTIDSGATISALPSSDAEALDIRLGSGTKLLVSGVGGEEILAWRHNIRLRFAGDRHSFMVPFVFLNNPLAPRVLGREGIFDRFTLIFEEKKRRSGLLSAKSPESKAVSAALDRIARSML